MSCFAYCARRATLAVAITRTIERRTQTKFAHGKSEILERPAVVVTLKRTRRRLGQRLRELRHGRGWSQAAAAEVAGLHTVHVTRLEAGAANPTLATLVALAVAYGVPVATLLE